MRRGGTAVLGVVVSALVCAVAIVHAGSDGPASAGVPSAGTTPGGRAGALDTAPALAAGRGGAIGPGTATETPGAGICTAGFVFTAGGTVLLAQAAHCAGTGDASQTDGCTSATLPVGTPVTVHAAGRSLVGTLRYSSWVAMQRGHEPDRDTCAYNDFALVELPPGSAPLTSVGLPFGPGPRGVRTAPLAPGTAVVGLAAPGADRGRPVVGPRTGHAIDDAGRTGGWLHTIRTDRPGVPGESGAPLVDRTGLAVGLLSGMEVDDPEHLEYTDLARAVDYAVRHGAPRDLVAATVPPPPAG